MTGKKKKFLEDFLPNRVRPSFKAALIYFITAFLWIFFSDALMLRLARTPEQLHILSTGKEWLFVLFTATILFMILRHIFKKEEQNLKKLLVVEKRFEVATEAAGIGVWELDIIHDRLVWDDRMFELYGKDRIQFEEAYEAWADCVHPDDRQRTMDEVTDAEAGRKPFNTEFRIVRPDGQVLHLRAFGKVIRAKDGTPLRMIGTNQDITERKKSQTDLEESQRLLRTIIDTIPSRVWWKDRNSRFLGCNIHFARDARLERPEQLIGKTDRDFYCSDDLVNHFIDDDREVFESGKPKLGVQEAQRQADGNIRWLEINKIPLRTSAGEIIGTLGTYSNITERKKSQTDLEESQRLLRTIIDTIPSRVWWKDRNSCFLGCNIHFARDAGLERPEQLIGKTDRDFCCSDDQASRFIADDREVFESGKPKLGVQEAQSGLDGNTRWLQINKVPLRTPDGKIIGTMGTYEDITDERAHEEQLQQAQKMEAVGQLAGGIAHDFNNILQAILGFSELLLPAVEKEERPRNNVLEIRKAAKHAADLTKQLLTFSRKQPIQINAMNLNTFITETKKILTSIIGENIRLVEDLQPDLNLIQADDQQVRRVVMNLAINARDAMPNGGQLTLRTRNVTFSNDDAEASVNIRAGGFVCMSVNDTGTGMSEKTMQHIFEPFFSTKVPGKGTGLGLASIYGIVQAHHGWINVDSEEGSGSTFDVYFPVSANEFSIPENPDSQQRTMDEVHGKGERILLVEDDDAIRHLSEHALQSAGYTVTIAASAEEALQIFEKVGGAFDLLFSDVILPNQNGADLAATLKKTNPNLPVVLCSGYSGDRILAAGIDQKEFFFLEKPFSIAALLRLVRQVFLYKK